MNSSGLNQAFVQRLTGYAPVASLVQSISVEHPQDADAGSDAPFPYITISDVNVLQMDTQTTNGTDTRKQVSIWTRPTATKGAELLANEIGDAVYAALHNFDLVVPGANVINVMFRSSPGVLPDPDGKTRHKPLTFEIQMRDI